MNVRSREAHLMIQYKLYLVCISVLAPEMVISPAHVLIRVWSSSLLAAGKGDGRSNVHWRVGIGNQTRNSFWVMFYASQLFTQKCHLDSCNPPPCNASLRDAYSDQKRHPVECQGPCLWSSESLTFLVPEPGEDGILIEQKNCLLKGLICASKWLCN